MGDHSLWYALYNLKYFEGGNSGALYKRTGLPIQTAAADCEMVQGMNLVCRPEIFNPNLNPNPYPCAQGPNLGRSITRWDQTRGCDDTCISVSRRADQVLVQLQNT